MFWLNSDLVGLVLGLLVLLVMALVGWMTGVPFSTAAKRAILGMIVGYVLGYFASARIRKALTRLMVKDRLERARRAKEGMADFEQETESGGGTPDENEPVAPQ